MQPASHSTTHPQPVRRPKRAPKPNPIETAIKSWLTTVPTTLTQDLNLPNLLSTAPKRWVIYEPMVLLPSGSFVTPSWQSLLANPDAHPPHLWQLILTEVSTTHKSPLTHLAVNEGIPLHQASSSELTENVVRSPTGLRMLAGDFGPVVTNPHPTQEDFEKAFWVTTRQNGIAQTWAPRYTMFSRGNVTEKARLLGFHSSGRGEEVKGRLRDGWAVDLYGGIGYFVFSYAKLGMRVLAWEINPWSVEGLRRGARMNRWTVRVVGEGQALEREEEEDRIVVFLEDNRKAEGRMRELRQVKEVDVVHVNCGLLPYSTDTWRPALEILGEREGWLHLHENVGIADIEGRRGEIGNIFEGWLDADGSGRRTAVVEHVEKVKTFAPGVWHCVFDVHVSGKSRLE